MKTKFRVWGMGFWVLGLVLLCGQVSAADLTTGYSFSSGEQNITHTKLNNAVNNATILAGFITDKAAVTAPASSDLALIYSASAGALRKVSVGNLFTSNPGLITNQVVDASPAGVDSLLTFDLSDGILKQATINNVVFDQVNGLTFATPLASDGFLFTRTGTNNFAALSNMTLLVYGGATFTNLATETTPEGPDGILIYDNGSGTNRLLTISNLFTGPVLSSGLTNGDTFLYWDSTNNVLRKVTASQMRDYFTNNIPSLATTNQLSRKYATTNVWGTAATSTTNAHGLAVLPSMVKLTVVCTNAANGYVPGDVIEMGSFSSSGSEPPWSVSYNATSIVVRENDTTTMQLINKDSGDRESVASRANFLLRLNAVYFP